MLRSWNGHGAFTDRMVGMHDWERSLKQALTDVMTTVFNHRPMVVRPEDVDLSPDLSAIVGFGGRTSGFLALHLTSEGACTMASGLLGMSFDGIDEIVADAMGEVVNVLAGGLKKHASSDKELFKISVPSIICGKDYSIHAPKDAAPLALGVQAGPCSFLVQLVVELL